VLSYADRLYFGLVACRDSVPSMQRLALHIGEALDELEATFLPRPAKASSAAARGRPARPRPGRKSVRRQASRSRKSA
jgi:diacylglycerol O-acyltransferase